jgi:hypothetical protein
LAAARCCCCCCCCCGTGGGEKSDLEDDCFEALTFNGEGLEDAEAFTPLSGSSAAAEEVAEDEGAGDGVEDGVGERLLAEARLDEEGASIGDARATSVRVEEERGEGASEGGGSDGWLRTRRLEEDLGGFEVLGEIESEDLEALALAFLRFAASSFSRRRASSLSWKRRVSSASSSSSSSSSSSLLLPSSDEEGEEGEEDGFCC